MAVTLQDIQAAAATIAGAVVRTPAVASATLSELSGAKVTLKLENLQFTSSFKDRGALVKLASLSAQARRSGVVAMSAGNHAQGVSYHAKRLAIPATIVMPIGTANLKIRRTEAFGADVHLFGETLDEAGNTPTGWRGSRT